MKIYDGLSIKADDVFINAYANKIKQYILALKDNKQVHESYSLYITTIPAICDVCINASDYVTKIDAAQHIVTLLRQFADAVDADVKIDNFIM